MATPDIPFKQANAGDILQHVGHTKYQGAPLFFARAGKNRFDDPKKRYGVLYLASDLATALMESVFREHHWDKQQRSIPQGIVDTRSVRIVGVLSKLLLANLTAPNIMAAQLGLTLEQFSSRRYGPLQELSRGIWRGTNADGILYPSRNNYPGSCIALFSRAVKKVQPLDDIALAHHTEWPGFLHTFNVTVTSP